MRSFMGRDILSLKYFERDIHVGNVLGQRD